MRAATRSLLDLSLLLVPIYQMTSLMLRDEMMDRIIGLEKPRDKALSIHLCDFGYLTVHYTWWGRSLPCIPSTITPVVDVLAQKIFN